MKTASHLFLFAAIMISLISPAYACDRCNVPPIATAALWAFVISVITFQLLSALSCKCNKENYKENRKGIFIVASIVFIISFFIPFFMGFKILRQLSKIDIYYDLVLPVLLIIMLFYLFRIKALWDDYEYARFCLSFLIFIIPNIYLSFVFLELTGYIPILIVLGVPTLLAIKLNQGKPFYQTCQSISAVIMLILLSRNISSFLTWGTYDSRIPWLPLTILAIQLIFPKAISEMKPLRLKSITDKFGKKQAAKNEG